MDGRMIRDAVLAAVEESPGPEHLPPIYEAVNEIALRAVTALAAQEGWREGAAMAANRRAMLVAVAAVAQRMEESLSQRAEDLRDEGATWTEIGQLMGLSRDGAARRFDPVARQKALAAWQRSRAKRQEASAAGDTSRTVARSSKKPRRSDSE